MAAPHNSEFGERHEATRFHSELRMPSGLIATGAAGAVIYCELSSAPGE